MRKMMITGYIVADAKKEVSPTGNERIAFRIGNTEYNNAKDEEGKPMTYWFNVVSFNPRALAMVKYLTKGKPVIIIGDYTDNIYQSKQTGNCEIGRNIIADSVEFVNFGSNNENTSKTTTSDTNTTTTSSKTEMPKVTNSGNTKKEMKATKVVLSDDSDDDDELPF